MKNTYQVGDTVIAQHGFSRKLTKHMVVRCTKLYAILENGKRLNIGNTSACSAVGNLSITRGATYQLGTPELIKECEEAEAARAAWEAVEHTYSVIRSMNTEQLIELTEALTNLTGHIKQ